MKLAELLAELGQDELDRLVQEHIKADEPVGRVTALSVIEGVLRGYQFVHEFVMNRQPPTFSVLALLLDAPNYTLPTAGFREAVLEETARISDLVTRGEIIGRDDQLRLYRRVLYEVRRNDLAVDPTETAILAVLRRELDIAQVEHFLIEYHSELQEFWNTEHCFLHEINALRTGGLVFVRGGSTMLAADVAPLVRQALGIDMPREHARRLFAQLVGQDLYDALAAAHVKTSGSKEQRIERLLQNMVQPRMVLRLLNLSTLRDLCRDSGASVSGAKDELVDRLVQHYAAGRDQIEETPIPPPICEPRRLDVDRFRLLFASLKGTELSDILRAFPELRQSGTKDVRIATLWDANRAEATLLGVLRNSDLEDILARLDQRLSGSKAERITRIIDHFAQVDSEKVALSEDQGEESFPSSDAVE